MANRTPPPLPSQAQPRKSFRRAVLLNLFLPGAGQFYLGQRTIGAALGAAFLVCLLVALAIFLVGYARYFMLALSGDILEGDKLEQIQYVFHPRWVIGLAALGSVIFLASMILLWVTRRKDRSESRF